MLKTGCWVLTIWAATNLVMSLAIIANTLLGRAHTPALYLVLTESDVAALSASALATLDSIALFANGLNVVFCILTLCLIWRGLFHHQTWSFWGLLLGFSAAWGGGVAADFAVGNTAPWVNVVSLGVIRAGLVLSAIGLFWTSPQSESCAAV